MAFERKLKIKIHLDREQKVFVIKSKFEFNEKLTF